MLKTNSAKTASYILWLIAFIANILYIVLPHEDFTGSFTVLFFVLVLLGSIYWGIGAVQQGSHLVVAIAKAILLGIAVLAASYAMIFVVGFSQI